MQVLFSLKELKFPAFDTLFSVVRVHSCHHFFKVIHNSVFYIQSYINSHVQKITKKKAEKSIQFHILFAREKLSNS